MISEVFIVVGRLGDHSDYAAWKVAAYTDREQAVSHADAARAWWKDHPVDDKQFWVSRVNPFDAKAPEDYGEDAEYRVEAVKLFLHFDQFQEATP